MNQVKDKNSERRTLFVSLILSFPGPIILEYSMLSGVNATQIHSKSGEKTQLKSQREVYIQKINQIKTLSDTEKEMLLKKLDMYLQSEMQCICHGDFHPMNMGLPEQTEKELRHLAKRVVQVENHP